MKAIRNYIMNQLTRQPKTSAEKVPLSQKALRGAILFFVAMFLLQFVSFAASEALVAKVQMGGVSSGVIDNGISGRGK